MLLTEDMRGWILICSQYHMNCYHTCLSFSLQYIFLCESHGLFGRDIKSYGMARLFSKVSLSCDIQVK